MEPNFRRRALSLLDPCIRAIGLRTTDSHRYASPYPDSLALDAGPYRIELDCSVRDGLNIEFHPSGAHLTDGLGLEVVLEAIGVSQAQHPRSGVVDEALRYCNDQLLEHHGRIR